MWGSLNTKKLFATLAVVFSFGFFVATPFEARAQATTTPTGVTEAQKQAAISLFNTIKNSSVPPSRDGKTFQLDNHPDITCTQQSIDPEYDTVNTSVIISPGSISLSCTQGELLGTCSAIKDGGLITLACTVKLGGKLILDQAGNFLIDSTTTVGPNGTTTEITSPGGEAIVEAGLNAATAPFWWMLQFLGHLIITFSAFLLGVAGILFNWTVYLTVFQFGNLVGNSAGMLAAWKVLRDIGNIALLFGFVFMGIGTILNLHTYNAKKALPSLIIFAVLLNFSLFAAEAVIDTSNIFASQMYNQAGICDSGSTAEECQKDKNYGIAGKVIDNAGVSATFDIKHLVGQAFTGDRIREMTVLLGMSLFLLITALVLIAGSIMLIIRAVTLTFIIVTSPIGFAGMAIPPFHGLASEWWKKLLSQAFFAPVYILMILISLKLMEGIRIALGSGTAENTDLAHLFSDTGASSVTALVTFGLLIGLMIGAMMAAKSMGAMGAGFATNTASALVFGGLARGANLTSGLAANGLRGVVRSRTGRALGLNNRYTRGALRSMSTANLDMRRIPGVTSILNAGNVTAGAKVAEHATYKDMEHMYQDIAERKADKDLEREFQKEERMATLEKEAHDGALTPASQKYLASLSEKELIELHGIKSGISAMAENLSKEQMEALMKSDKLDATQKEALKKARSDGFGAALRTAKVPPPAGSPPSVLAAHADAQAKVKSMTKKMSDDDLEAFWTDSDSAKMMLSNMSSSRIAGLSGGVLENPDVHQHLSVADFEEVRKKNNLTNTQRQALAQHIQGAQGPRGQNLRNYVNSLSAKEAAFFAP